VEVLVGEGEHAAVGVVDQSVSWISTISVVPSRRWLIPASGSRRR
jgi:hypothetical protein